ncbi:MAG: M20/M25/M40 family metallo-hydrolase [Gemmatimonadetes bacterium]|nr:M20/M25/M40 family metallo-hydrolase [Gemmatimonadota bacterium]
MPALDPIALAEHLVEVDSTSGREAPALERMEAVLRERAWRLQRIPVSEGRWNIFATSGDAPRVTLSTHLDTVPPFIPPRRADGRLYGRGACDAKGIAAAMVVAAERVRSGGVSVGLLFVVGEETAHDGAAAANRHTTSSQILINGEPTEGALAVGTKGAMRAVVRVAGQAAHSAYPHLGRSATAELVALLHELRTLALPSDPVLGDTTVNIGFVSGGVADNVLAPAAEARLMARLVGPARDVEARLSAWVGTRGTIEFGTTVPAVHLGTVPGFPTGVVAFASKPYLYGPGSIHVAHTDGEYVEEAELRRAVDGYELLVHEALARL